MPVFMTIPRKVHAFWYYEENCVHILAQIIGAVAAGEIDVNISASIINGTVAKLTVEHLEIKEECWIVVDSEKGVYTASAAEFAAGHKAEELVYEGRPRP